MPVRVESEEHLELQSLNHRSLICSATRSKAGGIARILNFTIERERMVQALIEEGLLKTSAVIEAIRKVPRELFVSVHLQQYAYVDTPLPTEYGQTISAPLG